MFLPLKKASLGQVRLDIFGDYIKSGQLNEDILRRLVDRIRPEAAGRASLHEAIRRASAHGRAVYLARVLHKTPASERRQLVAESARKRFLTPDVLTHLRNQLATKRPG